MGAAGDNGFEFPAGGEPILGRAGAEGRGEQGVLVGGQGSPGLREKRFDVRFTSRPSQSRLLLLLGSRQWQFWFQIGFS